MARAGAMLVLVDKCQGRQERETYELGLPLNLKEGATPWGCFLQQERYEAEAASVSFFWGGGGGYMFLPGGSDLICGCLAYIFIFFLAFSAINFGTILCSLPPQYTILDNQKSVVVVR